MRKHETDILIIGGGAAGMSAAVAASSRNDARLLIVDDNPRLGGQIWRAELGKIRSPAAKKLIGKLNEIEIFSGAQMSAQNSGKTVLCEASGETIEIKFEKLILATGARELFLPFPNWTLPNIFGAGGLQALVKNGFSVDRKRIVVAGTGPLLLVVAEYLKSKGAQVLLIAEQTSLKNLGKFAAKLVLQPGKLLQALDLRAKLLGISYLKNSFVISAEGNGKLEAVNLSRSGKIERIDCDMLACGYHLIPNTEAAEIFGCEITNGGVLVNEFQESSFENVFCAGETTGIGGVERSLIEGEIAGFAAIGEKEKARRCFRKREKIQKFAESLNKAFALREELKGLADDETIVCRCEDIALGAIKNFGSFRSAKLQTRCGMGACQGRICGTAAEFLFGWERNSVRAPIFPVKLENL